MKKNSSYAKQAEELKQCYHLVQRITKPKQQDGLSHVQIPTNQHPPNKQPWEAIYGPHKIEELVLQLHCKHFSQAHGTVFTQEPLRFLVDNKCTSNYAQQILVGIAQINQLPIDKYTKALLRHLKSK